MDLKAKFAALTGKHKQPPPPRPRLLVISQTYQSALSFADAIDRAGFVPTFVAAKEMEKLQNLDPIPSATLVLREVEDKIAVCTALRASPIYGRKPLVAIATLTENTITFPADAIIRPPSSLDDAFARLKALSLNQEAVTPLEASA